MNVTEEWLVCLGTYRQDPNSKEPVTDYSSRSSRIIKISSFVVVLFLGNFISSIN